MSQGVSNLLASLGHTGGRAVWSHTLNTQTLMNTDEQKQRLLNKFTILYWATITVILGHLLSFPVCFPLDYNSN